MRVLGRTVCGWDAKGYARFAFLTVNASGGGLGVGAIPTLVLRGPKLGLHAYPALKKRGSSLS